MAPNARNPRTTAATRMAALPVLLLLAGGVISGDYGRGASAATTTDDASEARACDEQFDECIGSDVCTSCVFSFAEQTSCTGYPFDPDNECDLLGVSYCCAAEASGVECSIDGFTLNYWECALEANDCSLGDMPCLLESTSDRSISESEDGDAEYFTSEGALTDDPDADLESGGPGRRGPAPTRTVAAGVAAAIAIAFALPLH